MRPRVIRTVAIIVVMTAAILLPLLVMEGILRAIDYAPGELRLFRDNPSGRGSYRLRPHLSMNIPFAGMTIPVTTNSFGMRGPEVSLEPSPGRRRVAFLGDSFTFGQWAGSYEKSFVGEVAARLAPRDIEVLGFGVPGYGFLDEELLLEEEVLRFRPDTVVLVMYNGNDFLDTLLGVHRYAVSANGELDADETLLNAKIPAEYRVGARRVSRQFRERLYVARVVAAGLAAVRPLRPVAGMRGGDPDLSYTSNLFWSSQKLPRFGEQATAESLAALRRIAARCRASGVRVVVAALPSMEQVRLLSNPMPGFDAALPQRHVATVAAAEAVTFIDLLPVLSSRPVAEMYHLHDGHLTTAGHWLVGRFLSEQVAASRR